MLYYLFKGRNYCATSGAFTWANDTALFKLIHKGPVAE